MTISDLIIAHGINMSRDSALLSAAASPDMSHIIVRILNPNERSLQDPWLLCRKTLSRTVACKEHKMHEHTRRLAQWPK